jgi:ribonuclease J
MRFKIHRGSKETGSSCVEIWTDKARIVIDTGTMPADDEGILPDIPSLYEEGGDTALFISHSDKDHYALIRRIHPSCPVWIGRTTYWLIKKKCEFLGEEFHLTNVHFLDYMNSVKTGDIEVHSCMTDNFSFDDYSFFIHDEACGEKMFFMCSARHREKKIFDYFLKKHNHETDYLLIEDSSTVNNDENFQTEEDLFDEFIQTFRRTRGINLVFVSETDIARIETVYRACARCQKIFLTDFYTASVLKTINKKARDTIPFPSRENYPEVFVYYPTELLMITEERKKEKEFIDHFLLKKHVFYNFYLDELDKKADRIVMFVSPHVQPDLEKHLHRYSDGCFIYSMREEHKQNENNRKFLDFIAGKGMQIKNIHSSAHVDLSALKQTVETLKPKQIVHIYDYP